MTDIFFSYKSEDRERVRPVRNAFAAQGFDVFWDQEVPAGVDWDTWIRQHLARSKCAIVFWSATSVLSDNVRHEAAVAKQQGKLIPALLERLRPEQFPMGLYTQQAVDLAGWSGDFGHAEWEKLRREVEAKLTPLWVQRTIHGLEAELVAERARREAAEARGRTFEAQIAKEAQTQMALKREKETAEDEVAALQARLEEAARARSDLESRAVDLQRRLSEAEATRAAAQQQGEEERRQKVALQLQVDGLSAEKTIKEQAERSEQSAKLTIERSQGGGVDANAAAGRRRDWVGIGMIVAFGAYMLGRRAGLVDLLPIGGLLVVFGWAFGKRLAPRGWISLGVPPIMVGFYLGFRPHVVYGDPVWLLGAGGLVAFGGWMLIKGIRLHRSRTVAEHTATDGPTSRWHLWVGVGGVLSLSFGLFLMSGPPPDRPIESPLRSLRSTLGRNCSSGGVHHVAPQLTFHCPGNQAIGVDAVESTEAMARQSSRDGSR